jgi:hypothetical protein
VLLAVGGVVLLPAADEVDTVVVSDAVVVASVVVAVKAETMPVLKVPIMMRLITRTLAAESGSAGLPSTRDVAEHSPDWQLSA